MLLYATVEELEAEPWNVEADNASVLLRMASGLVGRATCMAVYATDDDRLPTDAGLKQAMLDATCAQAAFWHSAGIDPSSAGVPKSERVPISKSIGGASVAYAQESVTGQQARAAASKVLCDEAVMILRAAGLVSSRPGMS